MEPTLVIIGLIVIVVIVMVVALRSRRGSAGEPRGGTYVPPASGKPRQSRDQAKTAERPSPQPIPPQQARPGSPPQPTRSGETGGSSMTGPNAAAGGYPPINSNPDRDDFGALEPKAAEQAQPSVPIPALPPQPITPAPPLTETPPAEQWQSAEPPREELEGVHADDEVPMPADDDEAAPDLQEREESTLETAAPEPQPAPKSEVNFTAFYPRTAQATRRYGLYIYAHLPTALTTIQTDAQKFTQELGGSVPAPRTTKQPTQIAEGQPITITPECEGLTFDPPTLTKHWDAPYVRYEFDFKPTSEQIGDELQGRALIAVAGIEVAQLKFTIEVVALDATPTDPPLAAGIANAGGTSQPPTTNQPLNTSLVPPSNPLAAAKQLTQSDPAKLYTKIFISYSRKDKPVAEAYRLAQLALGNDVFMDTYSIRTGEDWRVALARAIDSADIFQLFWSENSAASDNVRNEWDYALHYRCAENHCVEFIRPVFWKAPMPVPPPAELSHLNFRYVPLVQE